MRLLEYKKNFLTEVIVRIDFANPIDNISEKLPKNLTKSLLSIFPITEPKKKLRQQFLFSPKSISTEQKEFTEWQFIGKEREKTLTISPNALFISFTTYKSYTKLRDEFMSSAKAFFDAFPETVASRLGLRYINTISLPNGDPLNWKGIFNENMLSIFDLYENKKVINRALHVLEFNFDSHNLRYQYGMHNPDYPAVIKKKTFILDFDAYQNGLLTYEDVSASLDVFHGRIQELFELSIQDKLRSILNERKSNKRHS